MSIFGEAIDFACEIDDVGNDIEIEEITATSYNKYGDATETTGTIKGLKAVWQVLTFEDKMVQEGLYRSGDALFFISVNEKTKCGIKQKNKIIYNYQKFEIMEIVPHEHDGDTTFIYEVRAQRI